MGPNCFESHFPVAKTWIAVHRAPRCGGAGCSLCKVAQLGCSANSKRGPSCSHYTDCELSPCRTVSATQRNPMAWWKQDGYYFHPGSVLNCRFTSVSPPSAPVLAQRFSSWTVPPPLPVAACLLCRLMVTFDNIDHPQYLCLHCWPAGLQRLLFAFRALFPSQPLSPNLCSPLPPTPLRDA